MSAPAWRVLDFGPLPAWQQMALDAVIIRARAEDRVPNTLRFMEFSPHTALIGYHQAVDLEIHRDTALKLGVEINRRMTGGGAVYIDQRQLGWEFCLKFPDPHIRPDALYPALASVVINTLRQWHISAEFRPVNDVEVQGRKISGTGGTEYQGAIIYQGTLLRDFDIETMIEVLRLPVEKLSDKVAQSFRQRLVTMKELLGEAPPLSALKTAIMRAVEEIFDVSLVIGDLTPAEQMEWQATKESYRSPTWIDRRLADSHHVGLRQLAYKAPGGLIRIHASVEPERRRLRYVFITGDFFVQPDRAVLDLESLLKEAPLSPAAIEERIAAHYRTGVQYLGVSPQDWLHALSPLWQDSLV
ncbi:biotin/lipoate A/B protein ligase [Sulfobacillus acidophilus TPY]|uniref:Biotin/lipoate A/B protein ligase n=1 Tax=Sulfobacillus acidophilus (strain ATCC 700253 / DSM 10332 / NAL) TaxID=679936 RepID=G8TZ67_SULAD|nr:biotin/lipoate A/B protein ligase [Sulfobacillus acidophilus TPY]AEW06337.1 biotin/lipoate A/B protein ligase [Sulfobacillus acidophilus DSM 10332]